MKLFHATALFLLSLLPPGFVRGEEPASSHESPFSIEVTATTSREVGLENDGLSVGKMRTREYGLELEYRHRLPGERPRILTVGLELLREEFDGLNAGTVLPDTWLAAGLEASLTTVHNARWLSYLSATAGWHGAGTEDELPSDGFGFQAVALARYSINEGLHLAFGAHVDSLAEGSDRFNPVLGVEWLPAAAWKIALGVPQTGVFYEISDTLVVGFQADLKSDTYAVADDFRLRHGLPHDVKLEYFDVRAGLHLRWRFRPQASLTASVGTVLSREFKYQTDRFQRRLDSDGVDGGYGSLGLTFSF